MRRPTMRFDNARARMAAALAALMLVALPGSAYHFFYLSAGGAPVRWRSVPAFVADTDGPAGQVFKTMSETATGTWNDVPDVADVFGAVTLSAVNFTGANRGTAWGSLTGDGKYELVYDADGSGLRGLGLDPADTNGYGPSRRELVGGQPSITDAFFIVTGTRADFDLQSTMIHELGHILGLAHSSVGMHESTTPDTALDKINLNDVPTMHPFSLPAGNTNRRTLEADDRAALRELYGGAPATYAGIAGTIKRCGTDLPVIGANVRAVSTTDAKVQLSRFSGYDNATGFYAINFLPPGSYKVIVEPMGVNDFTLDRFTTVSPTKAESDFDFEYLSEATLENTCTEEMPEKDTGIATVTAAAGSSTIGKDIKVGSPALAFVVDDTGSMSEEIAGVRNILNATVDALAALTPAKPFPLTAVVTFSDSVVKRIVSADPAKLKTVINSLYASGGGDCPEASNAALLVAGQMLKKNGVSILFTDADSRPDGPTREAVTSYYRSKGARLFTLLSGTCTGTITPTADSVALDAAEDGPACESPANSGPGSPNADEYKPPAKLGSQSAVTTFSNISNDTGGFFVAIPGVNSTATEKTRYENVGTNLSVSAVLPAVALITPTSAPRGATFTVEVLGSNTNFINSQSTVGFSGTGVTVNSVTVITPTKLNANITVASSATNGFRDITVSTNLGGSSTEVAKGIGALNVVDPPTTPTTISATPSQGAQGTTVDVVINAVSATFTTASTANFGAGITVVSNTLISSTALGVRLQIASDATIGYRRVTVTTGSSTTVDNTPTGAFQVTVPTLVIPIIQSVTPSVAAQGSSVTLTITGLNTSFVGGATTVAVSGTGVSVEGVSVTSSTTLTANISVAAGATLGFRDITATTGGQSATILNGLQVTASACVITFGSTSATIPAGGTSGTFVLNSNGPTCTWTLTSSATWLRVNPPSGTGTATITYTADANPGAQRQGTITGAGQTFTATQDKSPCSYGLAPTSASVPHTGVENGTFAVNVTGSGCAWTASSDSSWAQVFPLSGTGTGTITYRVFPNFNSRARSAKFTVGGQLFSISQEANSDPILARYVRLLYFAFLARVPTLNDIYFQLGSGASKTDLAYNFFNSAEFKGGGRFVAALYVALLQRDAEYGGWQFQRLTLPSQPGGQNAMAQAYTETPEFQLKFGTGMDNAAFVRLMYRNILGREASAAEVDFQVRNITNPGGSRGAMVTALLQVPEFDLTQQQRLQAFLLYASLLMRDSSTDERTARATELKDPTALRRLIDAFVNSAEMNALIE